MLAGSPAGISAAGRSCEVSWLLVLTTAFFCTENIYVISILFPTFCICLCGLWLGGLLDPSFLVFLKLVCYIHVCTFISVYNKSGLIVLPLFSLCR